MSDLSNEATPFSTQRTCECYKKLETHGIPLYKSDENEFYGESPKKITFENAFKLPGILRINENINTYLLVEHNDLSEVFNYMSDVIPNLSDFEENVLSFWILDMFIEGLWTAQNANMNFDNQKATLLWIAYMFNYIQKESPTRKDLFDHLKKVLFYVECKGGAQENPEERTGESVSKMPEKKDVEEQKSSLNWKEKQIWKLPLPPNIEATKQKELDDEMKLSTSEVDEEEEIKSTNEFSGEKDSQAEQNDSANDGLTNLNHMKVIIEILYRIFARFWVYSEIQTVFHAMPSIKEVDLPFTLKSPKPLLKADSSTILRSDKIGRRQSYSEKSLEEIENDRQMHKNEFILPLQAADESKLILKQYFPQPSSRSLMSRRKT